LIIGLREAIAMIEEEGLHQVFVRHDRNARAPPDPEHDPDHGPSSDPRPVGAWPAGGAV
jgi:hypothetical protein